MNNKARVPNQAVAIEQARMAMEVLSSVVNTLVAIPRSLSFDERMAKLKEIPLTDLVRIPSAMSVVQMAAIVAVQLLATYSEEDVDAAIKEAEGMIRKQEANAAVEDLIRGL